MTESADGEANAAASRAPKKVLVCVHQRLTDAQPSCAARGGARIADLLETEIARLGLAVPVERFICFGLCDKGPNVRLAPGGAFYHGVTPDQIAALGQAIRRFVDGEPV